MTMWKKILIERGLDKSLPCQLGNKFRLFNFIQSCLSRRFEFQPDWRNSQTGNLIKKTCLKTPTSEVTFQYIRFILYGFSLYHGTCRPVFNCLTWFTCSFSNGFVWGIATYAFLLHRDLPRTHLLTFATTIFLTMTTDVLLLAAHSTVVHLAEKVIGNPGQLTICQFKKPELVEHNEGYFPH